MFIPLVSLQEAQDHSQKEDIVIFKHSSQCSISSTARAILEEGIQLKTLTMPIYLVVVQDQRTVSNNISQTLQVKHESPQCLVLKNGKVTLVLNHHQIAVDNIQNRTKQGDQNLACPVT